MEATLNSPFGQTVLGTALVSIGSTPGNQLMLNDPGVGAYHAEVRRAGQGHSIMDFGSGAGTFVNEQRLPPNVPRMLQNGDNVRVGNTRLTYTVTSGSPIPPPVYAAPGQLPGSGYSGYPVPPAPYGSDPYSVPATPQSSVPPPNPYVSDPYRASAGVFGVAGYGAPPPPPKQRGRRGLWITLGVIGVVLVLGVILLAVVGRRSNSTSIQASPSTPTLTLTNYCNAIKKGDYQTAYNQLSSYQQHQQTEAQFAATFANVTGCSVNSVDDTTGTGTIAYTVFNGNQVAADEKLIKENGVWKLAAEQAQSTPTMTLNQYCNAIKNKDYQTAYNQLSSDQQHQQTEAQFAATFANVTGCAVNSVDDTAGTGTITYTGSNGQQVVTDEKLIKENNVWKLADEQAQSTPTMTLNQYCNAIKNKDYQTAYSQLSNGQQQQQTEAQFAATFANVTGCAVNSVDDTAGTGTITYTISNGQQVVVDEKLIKENNVWKLAAEQAHK